MLVLGITGNSGSGKSAVCEILKKRGAYIIDADAIARKVLEKTGEAYGEAVGVFGRGILFANGEINRKILSDIVFNDEEKLKKLNRITHKYVIKAMKHEIEQAKCRSDIRLICLDVPLLFESGTDSLCDMIWLVDAPYETKLRRIMLRDGLSREKAAQRLARQTNPESLKELAHSVIENSGDLTALEDIVNKINAVPI